MFVCYTSHRERERESKREERDTLREMIAHHHRYKTYPLNYMEQKPHRQLRRSWKDSPRRTMTLTASPEHQTESNLIN